jgi:hypothetical protein
LFEYRNEALDVCECEDWFGQALDESADGNIAANTKGNREQKRQRQHWHAGKASREVLKSLENSKQYTR